MKKLIAAAAIVGSLILSAAPAHAARAPSSCLRALSSAERLIELNTTYTGYVADYFTAISTAAKLNANGGITGVTQFLNASTDATGVLTDLTNEMTPRVRTEVSTYRSAAAACRRAK